MQIDEVSHSSQASSELSYLNKGVRQSELKVPHSLLKKKAQFSINLNQCEVLDTELSENLRAKAQKNFEMQEKISRAFEKEDEESDSSEDAIDCQQMGLESKFMHTEETMGLMYENEHNSLIRISS
jgi:hypothetical protein